MRKLTYLFAIAAIGGLASLSSPSQAGPLAAGLAGAQAPVPAMSDDLVQKVHKWHCRKRLGWYRGHKRWHRHRRACYDDYDHYGGYDGGYDDDYYDGYGGYYGGYPYVGLPFFGFGFFDDDDDHHFSRRHHRRHRHHRKWRKWHKKHW
jgi:hypothetical protein